MLLLFVVCFVCFVVYVQMFYHYNIVQQLKHLHDVTLCPELFQESSSLTPSSFPSKEKSGGKKGDDKAGGTSKRSGGELKKEKRQTLSKLKEEIGMYVCVSTCMYVCTYLTNFQF